MLRSRHFSYQHVKRSDQAFPWSEFELRRMDTRASSSENLHFWDVPFLSILKNTRETLGVNEISLIGRPLGEHLKTKWLFYYWTKQAILSNWNILPTTFRCLILRPNVAQVLEHFCLSASLLTSPQNILKNASNLQRENYTNSTSAQSKDQHSSL